MFWRAAPLTKTPRRKLCGKSNGTSSFGDPSWSWIKQKLPALRQQRPKLGSQEKEPSLERVKGAGQTLSFTQQL